MTAAGVAARTRTLFFGVGFPLLLVVVVWKLFAHAFFVPHFGVVVDEKTIAIHDFASHLNFAKAFWRGDGGYGVEDHLRMTERFAGQRLPYALPFGYSPTMLWVLAPLCPWPTAWGFFGWTVAGVIAVLWICRRYRSVAVAAAFVGPVALGGWGLGQTAILTTVALLALMWWDRTDRFPRAAIVVLWALTAKPPLALAAATALLAGRRLGVVAAAVGLALVSTALLLPRLGASGVADYLHLLTHYDLDTAAAAFTWSLVPETMGNVRALLHVTFGMSDALAARLSTVLWVVASGAVVAAAWRRPMPVALRWSLAVLAYLVFCPHVSWTEEIALVVVVAAVSMDERPPGWVRWPVVAFAMVMLFLLPGIPFRGGARLPAAVVGKTLVGGLLWSRQGQRREDRELGMTPRTASVAASAP